MILLYGIIGNPVHQRRERGSLSRRRVSASQFGSCHAKMARAPADGVDSRMDPQSVSIVSAALDKIRLMWDGDGDGRAWTSGFARDDILLYWLDKCLTYTQPLDEKLDPETCLTQVLGLLNPVETWALAGSRKGAGWRGLRAAWHWGFDTESGGILRQCPSEADDAGPGSIQFRTVEGSMLRWTKASWGRGGGELHLALRFFAIVLFSAPFSFSLATFSTDRFVGDGLGLL